MLIILALLHNQSPELFSSCMNVRRLLRNKQSNSFFKDQLAEANVCSPLSLPLPSLFPPLLMRRVSAYQGPRASMRPRAEPSYCCPGRSVQGLFPITHVLLSKSPWNYYKIGVTRGPWPPHSPTRYQHCGKAQFFGGGGLPYPIPSGAPAPHFWFLTHLSF